jgi:hypothetical protein
MDKVRILKLIEYSGPRDLVEKLVSGDMEIEKTQYLMPDITIREVTLGTFSEIVEDHMGSDSEDAVQHLHGILADARLMPRYERYTAAAIVEVLRKYLHVQGFRGPYIDGSSLATGNDQTTNPGVRLRDDHAFVTHKTYTGADCAICGLPFDKHAPKRGNDQTSPPVQPDGGVAKNE